MAFDLSFSPEFFHSKDPHTTHKPYSVEMAIEAMSKADHASLATALKIDPQFLTTEIILAKVYETNTCTNLSSPVEVWIDCGGYHTIAVHDAPRHIPDLKGGSLCGAETGEIVQWLDRAFLVNCEACEQEL